MARKSKMCSILNLTEDSTALKPLTNNRPIAALPFVGRYRLIDFALSNLSYAGIGSVALFIGDSGRSIYDHVRAGDAWGLSSSVGGGVFTFSQQNWKKEFINDSDEDFYYNHCIYLKRSKADYVYVAGSNVLANVDIKALNQSHVNRGEDVTLVYTEVPADEVIIDEKTRRAVVTPNNGARLVPLDEATPDKDGDININMNMYMISVEKLYEIIEMALADEYYESIDRVIQHYISEEKLSVNTYKYTGYAYNINSIENYYKSNMDCLNDHNFAALFRSSIPVLTKTKHGAPTYYGTDSNVQSAVVATDTRIEGTVKNSIINRKVTIEKDAVIEDSLIFQGSKIGEGAVIKFAIIDKGSVVEPGAEIIGSPDDIIVLGKNSHIKA